MGRRGGRNNRKKSVTSSQNYENEGRREYLTRTTRGIRTFHVKGTSKTYIGRGFPILSGFTPWKSGLHYEKQRTT